MTRMLSHADIESLLAGEWSDELFESLAREARDLTAQRFGKTIKLYAPLYVSNACINGCLYCGFGRKSSIARRTLTVREAMAEAEAIFSAGHRHLLLVAGEDPERCPQSLVEEISRSLRPRAASIAVEIQPLNEAGYRKLADAGVDGVTLYQESYDGETYRAMHPFGPKSRIDSRREAIDAAGRAGMRFLGIGALLGLHDWKEEARALIDHARELMRRHWRSSISVSVPRIRDCATGFRMPAPVSDRDLARLIVILRLALPDCGIALSTREKAGLRDALLPLGVTQMSAGSATSPGGYADRLSKMEAGRGSMRSCGEKAGEQFRMEDIRPASEIAEMLKSSGYDAVWMDWESCLAGSSDNSEG